MSQWIDEPVREVAQEVLAEWKRNCHRVRLEAPTTECQRTGVAISPDWAFTCPVCGSKVGVGEALIIDRDHSTFCEDCFENENFFAAVDEAIERIKYSEPC